jgi:hypothetical protein
VILPAREVADMTCASKLGSPRLGSSFNLFIEADRKQHNLISLLFFFEGLLYLIFDPIALDRMLGQDQQQLIAQPDPGIDLVADFAANWHIVWREPAAHPLVLQVGVKALCEVLIFGRVADEAGIKLDGLGRQIINEIVRQADASAAAVQIFAACGDR